MVDVHIAHLPTDRQDWWTECEKSLDGHDVVYHHIDGVDGSIKQARINGFSMGHHEFVSFVDPDDVVAVGALEMLIQELTHRPDACGAYSLSEMIGVDGVSKGLIHPYREYTPGYLARNIGEIHQLVVMRRSAVNEALDTFGHFIPEMGLTEVLLYAQMARQRPWVAVNHVGYKWRTHPNGSHALSLSDRDHQHQMLKLTHEHIIAAHR